MTNRSYDKEYSVRKESVHMKWKPENTLVAPVIPGVEDKFYYVISEDCVMCGSCAEACPVQAITEGDGRYEIDPALCIDCGTCSYVCPLGVPQPV